MPAHEKPIIIYDGECKLCRQAVQFLERDETSPGFSFVPSSDPYSIPILNKHHIAKEITEKTVILIDRNMIYTKSTAIIKAMYLRGGFWRISKIFLLIPPFLRNLIYDWIARNRK